MNYRYKSRVVQIGKVAIGGDNPIAIQSMTTANTMDTLAVVEEVKQLYNAGCDIVRITAPNIASSKNLLNIKNELLKQNIDIPLVADIHFIPEVAIEAAKIVDKVRINPGNYSDTKRFKVLEYSREEYQLELERIREKFIPLVEICKQYKTAMRIGTNHGSLSDRIMNYYGDTHEGMVMSALEFLDICEELGFHDVVFSMKASNPLIMIDAYELLIEKMKERGEIYPIHLGVTEAGADEQGRIKSSIGIGALLSQGIGDTIRVSLTEDPIYEIPVARSIIEYYQNREEIKEEEEIIPIYSQRELVSFSKKMIPVVISDLRDKKEINEGVFKKLNYHYINNKWFKEDISSDYIYLNKNQMEAMRPDNISVILDSDDWSNDMGKVYPLFNTSSFMSDSRKSEKLNFLNIEEKDINDSLKEMIKSIPCVLLFKSEHAFNIHFFSRLILKLHSFDIDNPITIYPKVSLNTSYDIDDKSLYQIYLSCELSIALSKNLIQGVWTKLNNEIEVQTLFDCYQASRKRISKTEFISCPSCGRTYFDLKKVTQEIKEHTSHLKNVRIGIMGCIVNGPGEMADADFGYVGAGKGKVTLYKGKEVVLRNVDSKDALGQLIKLIKDNGMWKEKVDLKE